MIKISALNNPSEIDMPLNKLTKPNQNHQCLGYDTKLYLMVRIQY